MIKSWSYSRLLDYEKCAYQAKLKIIDKLPRIANSAGERGTLIHENCEAFVKDESTGLIKAATSFREELVHLKSLYSGGQVTLEDEWGFGPDWMPTDYKTAWLRMKADVFVQMSPTWAVLPDYKSGKKDGNEVKHGEQVLLYSIAAFIRKPQLDRVTAELWYFDQDELTQVTYTRNQALRYVQNFNNRAVKMTTDTKFSPNPSIHACHWCDYAPHRGGQCQYGVSPGQQPIKFYREKFTNWVPK